MKVYIGIFPTFWLITTRERLRWLILVIAVSFGVIGFKGGIFAISTGFHYRVWGPDNSFYGDNNSIAIALSIALPLIMLSAKEIQNKSLKLLFYCMFGLSACSVISSWSRGGLLSLCAVLTIMVLTGRRKWLSVPIVALGIMMLIPNLPEEWFARMDTIKTYEEDASAQNRMEAWRFAYERALRDPLTGGGFKTFQVAITGPHSGYFGILGEHGFVGLGLWLSLLLGTLIALERLRSRALARDDTMWIRDYARAIQLSLVGYAVGAAFLEVTYWDIFYHLAGMCAVLKMILKNNLAEGEAGDPVLSGMLKCSSGHIRPNAGEGAVGALRSKRLNHRKSAGEAI
jgi:probable O-glycosylation ligase (exosortase A-associated)